MRAAATAEAMVRAVRLARAHRDQHLSVIQPSYLDGARLELLSLVFVYGWLSRVGVEGGVESGVRVAFRVALNHVCRPW